MAEVMTTNKSYYTGKDPLDAKQKLSSVERLTALIMQDDEWIGMRVIIGNDEYIMQSDRYEKPEDILGTGWDEEWANYFEENWIIRPIGTHDGGSY